MKALRSDPARPAPAPVGPRAGYHATVPERTKKPKKRKAKKRKSLGRKLFSEAFDLIEDIFD